jgi:homoserine kinase
LPLGSGLGSSSASAVAAAVAVDALIGRPYSQEELLGYARFGERVACGAAHADNVAPCLLGGFCIVRSQEPLEIIRLDVPSAWRVAVVHPHVMLPTKKARAALPASVALSAMASNAANAAALVASIAKKDIGLFGRSVMAEAVVVPARRRLIPGFADAARAALHAGAAGVSISGAGPSLFALTDGDRRAKVVAARMVAAWKRLGIGADPFVSRIGAEGARILGNGRS